eukprot:TRINITY_DN774_c0_g2_i3.p1 TRINITY_DN774_c0_g2~~TRINITY_DN774_c0_g2_i3.p1  ORF type:complete len:405 (+),score=69.82 TRINITY_DN774_c0_g2_i3:172-1386(+)
MCIRDRPQIIDKTMDAYAAQDPMDVPPAYDADTKKDRCACWDKWWFMMIVVVCMVLLVGFLALTVFTGVEWGIYNSELNDLKGQNQVIQREWAIVNASIDSLKAKIETNRQLLEQERKKLAEPQEKEKKLSDDFHIKEKEYDTLKTQYKNILDEIERYKKENKELTESNAKLNEEIKNLKTQLEDIDTQLKLAEEELKILRIVTYSIGGVFVLGTVDDVIAHIQLSNLKKESEKLYPYVAGFERLSEGFENYEIMKWSQKKKVSRTNCFQGFSKNDLSQCAEKGPWIATITTSEGYKFGACFQIPYKTWVGNYGDADAFTFSHAHGLIAPIIHDESYEAFVVDNDNLLHFGKNDIVIPLAQHTGTLAKTSYDIPYPYSGADFYYNGTSFTASSISIDLIKTVDL